MLIEIFWHNEDYFLNTSKATLLNEQLDKLNSFLHFVMLGGEMKKGNVDRKHRLGGNGGS